MREDRHDHHASTRNKPNILTIIMNRLNFNKRMRGYTTHTHTHRDQRTSDVPTKIARRPTFLVTTMAGHHQAYSMPSPKPKSKATFSFLTRATTYEIYVHQISAGFIVSGANVAAGLAGSSNRSQCANGLISDFRHRSGSFEIYATSGKWLLAMGIA